MADVETLGILEEVQVLVSVKLQVVTNKIIHLSLLFMITHISVPLIRIYSDS